MCRIVQFVEINIIGLISFQEYSLLVYNHICNCNVFKYDYNMGF